MDRVLACGVIGGMQSWDMRGERTVIDNAPAARGLRAHLPERGLSTKQCPSHIDVHQLLPAVDGQCLHRDPFHAKARVIEEQVKAPEGLSRHVEQSLHRRWIGHVSGYRDRTRVFASRRAIRTHYFIQRILATAGQYNVPAVFEQRTRSGPADSSARPGHDCHAVMIWAFLWCSFLHLVPSFCWHMRRRVL